MEEYFWGALAALFLEIIALFFIIRLRSKMASWLVVFLCLFLGLLFIATVVFLGAIGFFMR